jgi:hypothetical protein
VIPQGLGDFAFPGQRLAQPEERVRRGAGVAGLAADLERLLEAPPRRAELPLIEEDVPQVVERGHLTNFLPDVAPDP